MQSNFTNTPDPFQTMQGFARQATTTHNPGYMGMNSFMAGSTQAQTTPLSVFSSVRPQPSLFAQTGLNKPQYGQYTTAGSQPASLSSYPAYGSMLQRGQSQSTGLIACAQTQSFYRPTSVPAFSSGLSHGFLSQSQALTPQLGTPSFYTGLSQPTQQLSQGFQQSTGWPCSSQTATGTGGAQYSAEPSNKIFSVFAQPLLASKSVEQARLEDYKQKPFQSAPTNFAAPLLAFSQSNPTSLSLSTQSYPPLSLNLSANKPSTLGLPTFSQNPLSSFHSTAGSSLGSLTHWPEGGSSMSAKQVATQASTKIPSSLFPDTTHGKSALFNLFPSATPITTLPTYSRLSYAQPSLSMHTTTQPKTGLFSQLQVGSLPTPPAQPMYYVQQQPSLFQGCQQTMPQISLMGGNPPQSTPITTEFIGSVCSAYRDSHGLSWLYPTSRVDDLLSIPRSRPAAYNPSLSLIERASKGKPIPQVAPYKNWRKRPERKAGIMRRPLAELWLSPIKSEAQMLGKRESFEAIKYKPFSTRDDTAFKVLTNKAPANDQKSSTVEVCVEAYDPSLVNFVTRVPKSMKIRELAEQTASQLTTAGSGQFKLMHRNRVLKGRLTLEQACVKDGDRLKFIVSEVNRTDFVLAPTEMLPKLTKPGYFLKPSEIQLARMTTAQLRSVANFTVCNQYGKVEFEGLTDVTMLDIDQIVQIESDFAAVYPPSSDIAKPKVGQGLNKPAKVTLYNCKARKTKRAKMTKSRS